MPAHTVYGMDRYESVIFLLTLFLATNLMGLMAAQNMQQHEEIQKTAEQHDSAASGIYFFIMIGISTVLLLLLYKYDLNLAIKGWLMLALAMTTLLFFTALSESIYGIIATVTVVIGIVFTDRPLVRNVLMMFPLAGAGAFFGSIFGVEAVLVLLVVLSLYDYFSVNISEHMVSLAKSGVESNTFMGFTYPREDGGIPLDDEVADINADEQDAENADRDPVPQDQELDDIELDESTDTVEDTETDDTDSDDLEQDDTAEIDESGAPDSADAPLPDQRGGVGLLGGGDIVIPLIFAAALLQDFGTVPAVMSVLGAGTGLGFLLVKAEHGKFYPAIPPVAIGSVAGSGIGWFIMQFLPAFL